jgi:hypothetical protein
MIHFDETCLLVMLLISPLLREPVHIWYQNYGLPIRPTPKETQ